MNETSNIHGPSLKAAQDKVMAGSFAEALDLLAPVLEAEPGHGEALYMTAVCQRYLEQFDKARTCLETLKSVQPEFGRAWQEEGHLLRAQGNAGQALQAYARACQYNPALTASWSAQAEISHRYGPHSRSRAGPRAGRQGSIAAQAAGRGHEPSP